MAQIITLHSFRGGTGKSGVAANLAVLMAKMGKRVGLIDMDIQSPSLQIIFGLKEPSPVLNDYLWEKAKIDKVAYDITTDLGGDVSGKLFLIPSSIKPREITRVLREGFDPTLVNEAFKKLRTKLELDVILVDTHAGINEETVLTITVSDTVVVMLRPDQLDYIGTNMSLEMTRRLNVAKVLVLVNKAPQTLDLDELKKTIQSKYDYHVAAVIPNSDDLRLLASTAIFALRHPQHAITQTYQQLAEILLA
jgi:MinD-like ATPase involved in chromosome partitioning or flagellar assembly